MLDLNYNERTKEVKKRISKVFPAKNVSVKKGSGTAASWVEVRVEISKPTDCECKPHDTYCSICRKALSKSREEVYKAINDGEPIKFSTYTSDDGFDSENSCLLVQTSFIR